MTRETADPRRPSRRWFRAFTLTELLVVIIIIVLVAAIAIPSFSAMIASSESTIAVTKLTNAMKATRDAAIRSGGDADAALVVFFEPGGKTTLVPCVKIGELDDRAPNQTNPEVTVRRELFVKSGLFEPVQLPKGWMVRGYASRGMIQTSPTGVWYEDGPNGTSNRRYTARISDGLGDWVFPETDFYNPDPAQADNEQTGFARQTFMIRFEAGSGRVLTGASMDAIIISPRPSGLGRAAAPYTNYRIDLSTDVRRFVRRVLSEPMIRDDDQPGPTNLATAMEYRQKLLGDESADTVLARPVAQVALYDEYKLAADLAFKGVRLDRDTGCFYVLPSTANPTPTYVPASVSSPELGVLISDWIEGDTNFDGLFGDRATPGPNGRVDAPQAKVFTIDRSSGEARQVEIEL